MIFRNREDAGRQLAARLEAYADREDVSVLGIPRGGVPLALEIANVLNISLDIFLSRKLGVPGQEELAFGAVAVDDVRFLDENIIRTAGISKQQVERIARRATESLHLRATFYRGDRPPMRVAEQTILLVDDGMATGASIFVAIKALRQMNLTKLVVAVPVGPPATCKWIKTAVDELVCLYCPTHFQAVGQFYEQFKQVADEEVRVALKRTEHHAAKTPNWES